MFLFYNKLDICNRRKFYRLSQYKRVRSAFTLFQLTTRKRLRIFIYLTAEDMNKHPIQL